MSTQNMQMVLQALKNAGLNDNQARILGAEIGRENAFQDKYLWGYHIDDANGAENIGMISWQGSRAKGVKQALANAGLLKNGKITKGQASLDVMAKYLVNEIRTNPAYAQTKKQFLDNPNVDYQTGSRVLGKNFIRWAYDNPKYASGHKNRDRFYAQLGGIVPKGGSTAETDNSTDTPATTANPFAELAKLQSPLVTNPPPTALTQPAIQAVNLFQPSPSEFHPQQAQVSTPNILGVDMSDANLLNVLFGMPQQPATQAVQLVPSIPFMGV